MSKIKPTHILVHVEVKQIQKDKPGGGWAVIVIAHKNRNIRSVFGTDRGNMSNDHLYKLENSSQFSSESISWAKIISHTPNCVVSLLKLYCR